MDTFGQIYSYELKLCKSGLTFPVPKYSWCWQIEKQDVLQLFRSITTTDPEDTEAGRIDFMFHDQPL